MTWVYPAIMLSAVGTAVALSRRTQGGLPLAGRERLAISLGAFCGAMIGAKLPFVLTDPAGLASGAAWFENGKTIVFGLVGGYFGVEIAKWAVDIRVKTGDSFAVPVAAAVAIGRLGCFAAGCCYGTHTALPWGVDFLGDGPRHPTQLYEFAFHATAALVLAWLGWQGRFPGQLIKLYIIAYLAFRFALEWVRPEPVLAFGLTGYQWACAALVPVFVVLWVHDRNALAEHATSAAMPPG
ncbi:MAG: prolipoprotein diacylglyceryl transferase [Planctomycetia bacterium]|nr:prolipoprotein diacylglyceryl transferase [Planctomycetia bacterium]